MIGARRTTGRRILATLAAGVASVVGLGAVPSLADQVIADDLIVQSSLCVGFDCVNNESFGFDTIRLKENNTRIKFEDTSTGAFPATDWQLTANDSAAGGLNKFSIEDVTAARVPFTIVGAAPTNSMFVDSLGRVGLRTATPVLDLHMATNNTPAVRLEQNNSGGFTAQTWDIAGNEANFFVRDLTGGSRLPFRIRPGAPTSSLDVAANGNVGMGTPSPADALHVYRPTGAVGIRLASGSQPGAIRLNFNTNNNEFRVNFGESSVPQLRLTSTGNVIIPGTLTTSGSCSVGCDRVFSEDYDLPSISEHARQMYANGFLPSVGQTVEGSPMNITTKVEGILNELEKAHIYIHQLEEKMTALEMRLAETGKSSQ